MAEEIRLPFDISASVRYCQMLAKQGIIVMGTIRAGLMRFSDLRLADNQLADLNREQMDSPLHVKECKGGSLVDFLHLDQWPNKENLQV